MSTFYANYPVSGGAALTIGAPANGLDITSNVLTISLASASNTGALSSTDWSTFNSKQNALGYTPENVANKGIANGYAPLDSGTKIPAAYLPNSIMNYLGTWDAATNIPTLANGTGNAGDVYICSVAGTVNFGAGPITFATGDWVIYSGSIWERSINSNSVVSVNGYTGVVVLNQSDVGLSNVDNTSDANKPVSTATQTALNLKANLSGAVFTGAISATNLSGTNTGDQDLTPYALLAGATFTGGISATNFSGSSSGTNTGDQDLSPYALLASPTFTGVPAAPTAILGTNTAQIATTAFVQAAVNASPSGTVTSVGAGTGLTGGPITTSGTISLDNTTVTPGSYTLSSITVDAQGRITAASSGSASSGANTALSNLTNPTAINQDLLQSGGKSVGATAQPWLYVIANEGHFSLIRTSTNSKTVIDVDNSVLNAGGFPVNKNGPVVDWADGNVNVPSKPNDSDLPRQLKLYKGAFFSAIKARDTLAANTLFELPLNNGTSGQTLTTNGSGTTSWSGVFKDAPVAIYQTAAGQSIASGTAAIVNFGTSVSDNTGKVTTGASWKYTATSTEKVNVQAAILFAATTWTIGVIIQLSIYKNGVEVKALDYGNFNASVPVSSTTRMYTGSFDIDLVATDFIDVRVFQNEGVAKSLLANSTYNYISIKTIQTAT